MHVVSASVICTVAASVIRCPFRTLTYWKVSNAAPSSTCCEHKHRRSTLRAHSPTSFNAGLEGRTVAYLQRRLREKGLPVSGRKAALIKRLNGTNYQVLGTPVPKSLRRAVRKAMLNGAWQMSLRNSHVHPPQALISRQKNPICELGECGDSNCALYRLKDDFEHIRPDILEYFTQKITTHANGLERWSLTYLSLGCGLLHFDWQLIERLIHHEGISLVKIWLVDPIFRPSSKFSDRASRARDAFANWFADAGFEIHTFPTAKVFHRWALAFPEFGKADVVMQCDAVETGPIIDKNAEFRHDVAHPGALNLQAYSQLLERRRPGPGRRRAPRRSVPVRRMRVREDTQEAEFNLLEEHTWKDGKWDDGTADLLQALVDDMYEEYQEYR